MGVDVGSTSTKIVIIKEGKLESYHVTPSGAHFERSVQTGIEEALEQLSLSTKDIAGTIATGYGANIPFLADHYVTDISCCAKGVGYLFPFVRTVIDIGGQASKVIRVNQEKEAIHFVVSERCAAGSGRFLQVIAKVLQIKLEDIGPLSLKAQNPITFTTACAVFGESEAVSRVAEGIPIEDIIAGVHNSIATKIANLVNQIGMEQDCVLTGGGALDEGLVKKIRERLGVDLLIPSQPQITAALGAAIIAEKKVFTST